MCDAWIGSQQDYANLTPNCTDTISVPIFLGLDHLPERVQLKKKFKIWDTMINMMKHLPSRHSMSFKGSSFKTNTY